MWEEICALCAFHNARAYINLNTRSFERVAYNTLKKLTNQIMNKDFKSVRKVYESACGELAGKLRYRIVDIDEHTIDESMIRHIENCQPYVEGTKIVAKLPTKNGWHLITKPFDVSEFHQKYPKIDIHKNSPTILFIP